MKPGIFIGSSSESRDIAYAIQENLEDDCEPRVWNQGVFNPTGTTIQQLVDIAKTTDFAVFVFSGDDLVKIRDDSQNAIRDNVIFEYGLFVGSIGMDRVFVIHPRESPNMRIPTDLFGLIKPHFYADRSDGNLVAALGPACNQIRREIERLKARSSSIGSLEVTSEQINSLGLKKIYPSYVQAEYDIIEDLKKASGLVRLFLQIGNRNVSTRGVVTDLLVSMYQGKNGTISDLLVDAQIGKAVEVQILHAGIKSPLFSRERLESLEKNSEEILLSLRHVHDTLDRLENSPSTNVRHRSHSFPFIWRMYVIEKHLYLMPYFSFKDAHEHSPVMLFEKSSKSLYETFVKWFDYMWEMHAPEILTVEDYVTDATPAGTALFLKWEKLHVFAIPHRDISDESLTVRFYGVGGKRIGPNEPLTSCAIREGNEETGAAIASLVPSPYTDFWDASGIISRISLADNGLRPRLILQKAEHTGRGVMATDGDFYYLIAYDAELAHEPKPSGEVAALLFLNDNHLVRANRNDVTLGELVSTGARIVMQDEEINIDPSTIFIPHGTAAYLCQRMSQNA